MDKQMIARSVLGSFIGDSLALGAHWIYDVQDIERRFGRVDVFLAPGPDSYHPTKTAGEFTHYGDQAMVLLESVAACGSFDLVDFSRRWRSFFDAYTGYFDHATKNTLANFAMGWGPEDSGSPSTDLAGASRIAPLLPFFSEDLEALIQAAKNQTKMTHKSFMVLDSAAFFARTVFAVLHGATPIESMHEAAKAQYSGTPIPSWVNMGLSTKGQNSVQAIQDFGQSCYVEGAFQSVVHLISSYETNLNEALIQCVMSGGDSAARAMIVGMILGAFPGSGTIPDQWRNGLKKRVQIEGLLAQVG